MSHTSLSRPGESQGDRPVPRTRVLHAALMSHPEAGIYRQMSWEKAASGETWDCRLFTQTPPAEDPADIIVQWNGVKSHIPWVGFRRAYYDWLLQQADTYDVLVLRHSLYDPFRPFFVRRLRALGKVVASVHHTLELDEIESGSSGVRRRVKLFAERVFARMALRRVDLVVGVTGEIARYEISRSGASAGSYVYPNGAVVDSTAELVDRRQDVPSVLFVASYFHEWHGLDLILSSLPQCDEPFVLHVVGDVPPEVREGCRDSRVVWHGRLDGERISTLAEGAWVGLSSFALFRKGMEEACTLKVREYFAGGVPVYAGHADVFPAEFPYFRSGPASMTDVLAFGRTMRSVERRIVREHAIPYIDKAALVSSLHQRLETLHQTGSRGPGVRPVP